MSITHVPDEELLVFDHEIAAPVEDVFGAYLDPELLVRWYGPAGLARGAPPTCRGACRRRHAAPVHDQRG